MKTNALRRISRKIVKAVIFIVIILAASALLHSVVTSSAVRNLKFKAECYSFMLRNPDAEAELNGNSFKVHIDDYDQVETVGKKLDTGVDLAGEIVDKYIFKEMIVEKTATGKWQIGFDYTDKGKIHIKISQGYIGGKSTYLNDYSANSTYIAENMYFSEDIGSDAGKIIYIGKGTYCFVTGDIDKLKLVDIISKNRKK